MSGSSPPRKPEKPLLPPLRTHKFLDRRKFSWQPSPDREMSEVPNPDKKPLFTRRSFLSAKGYSNLGSGEEQHDLDPYEGSARTPGTGYTVPSYYRRDEDEDVLLEEEEGRTQYGSGSGAGEGVDEGSYKRVHEDFQRRHGLTVQPPAWDRRSTMRPNGVEGLQTHYDAMGDNTQSELARTYDQKKQLKQLLSKVLVRFVGSLLLAIYMVTIFYVYEKIEVLSESEMNHFHMLSTGFYLLLGLNLAGALKGMATMLRWKVLSRKRHSLEEVDLILSLNSLLKVLRYGIITTKTRPLTTLSCFGWIALNMVGRVSVAFTGLTYHYDTSTAATAVRDGIVSVTDWSFISEDYGTNTKPTGSMENYAAHNYGLFSTILETQNQTDDNESELAWSHPLERTEEGDWEYHFREFNPDVKHSMLAHKTERYVTIATVCHYFPLIEGQNGNSSTVVYQNGTKKVELKGIDKYGPGATTYVNPRSDLERNSYWNCGTRCTAVAALKFLGENDKGNGSFFGCEVRVSPVHHAKVAEHEIPDASAETLAGSIALEGYSVGPDGWEYARYPPGSPWSPSDEDADDPDAIADLVGRFAIGSIAGRDLFGQASIRIEGKQAWVGVLLEVEWTELYVILGMVLFIQLALGLAAVYYSNTVFCKDDSYLATARLLRPVVERLGPAGCALTGKEISHTLRQSIVYGVRTDLSGSRHHLDIGEDINVLEKFPGGWYDGEVDSLPAVTESEDEDEVWEDAAESIAVSQSTGVCAAPVAELRRR